MGNEIEVERVLSRKDVIKLIGLAGAIPLLSACDRIVNPIPTQYKPEISPIPNLTNTPSPTDTPTQTSEPTFTPTSTEIPIPTVPQNVITNSLGLINVTPVKDEATGSWVIQDMLGKTFWKWDNETQTWLDERPLYWQCGRGTYFVPSDYGSSVSEEAKSLPTGLMTDGEVPTYKAPGGNGYLAEHIITRACITDISENSKPLFGDVPIIAKVMFFDINGEGHEYNIGVGLYPDGQSAISFYAMGAPGQYRGAILDKSLVWLKEYWNNPSGIASRQLNLEFLTKDIGMPANETNASMETYLIKNRDLTLQLIEALQMGTNFPENVPDDFFLYIWEIGFLGEFQPNNW